MTESAVGEVEVKLAGSLANYSARGPRFSVPAGRTVAEVAAEAGLPADQRYIALVNSQTRGGSYVLAAGEAITLLPPIAGGQA